MPFLCFWLDMWPDISRTECAWLDDAADFVQDALLGNGLLLPVILDHLGNLLPRQALLRLSLGSDLH